MGITYIILGWVLRVVLEVYTKKYEKYKIILNLAYEEGIELLGTLKVILEIFMKNAKSTKWYITK